MLPSNSIRAQLSQILVQVKQATTDSPKTIQTFLVSIKSMMTKLQDEQKKHQEISDKMMDQCSAQDTFRASEVATAQKALDLSNSARGVCASSLKASQNDLPELQHAFDTYTDELAKATAQRKSEKEAYAARKADFESAIAFLKDFITFVTDKLKGSFSSFASFAEKSEHVLRHATKLGLLKEAVPILVAIASMQTDSPQEGVPAANNYGYTANADVAQKLKDTLTNLLNRLISDNLSNEKIESDALNAFTTLSTRLQTAIATLQTNIDRTNKQIVDMNKCMNDEDVIIKAAENKLNRNSELQTAAKNMCSQFATEFVDATNNRLQEIKTIEEILSIIETRFGKIPADIKAYLQDTENGWKTYTNSTAFQKFIKYKQVHTQGNANGSNLVAAGNLVQ